MKSDRKWRAWWTLCAGSTTGSGLLVTCHLHRRKMDWCWMLWPLDVKSWLIGKDPDVAKDWGTTEDEMVGWHHWVNGQEFEQTLGDSEGQGSLARCSPRGHKELDTNEQAITVSLLDKMQINRSVISEHKIKWSERWDCSEGRHHQGGI